MFEDLKCNRLMKVDETKIYSNSHVENRKIIFTTTQNHKQFANLLSRLSKFNLNLGLILIVIIGLFCCPSVSSQKFNLEDLESEFTHDSLIHPLLNQNQSSDLSIDVSNPPFNVGTPRIEAVKKDKRKYEKCPKKYRKTWCFNNGKCHWIEDLEKPSCRCKKNWEGPRCQDPVIDFTSNDEQTNQNVVIIAVVLSVVFLVAAIMTSCICWRRMKNVKKDLELEEVEKAKGLLSEKNESTNTLTAVDVA